MAKLTSGRMVFLIFVALSLLLIIVSSLLYYSLNSSKKAYSDLAMQSIKLELVSDARNAAGYMQISVLRYVIATTPDELDRQSAATHSYFDANGQRLQQLGTYIQGEDERDWLNQLLGRRQVYQAAFEELFALSPSASIESKMAFNLGVVRPAYDDLAASYTALSDGINRIAQADRIQADRQTNIFRTLTLAVAVLVGIAIIALALITQRIISRLRADAERLRQEMEERRRAIANLEASNKELESFAYSVSHDLRTPLRSLEGFSQALVEDYGDQLDSQAKSYLARIKQASITMAHLIDDILKLSRITRTELKTQEVDLSKLAGMAVAELQVAYPERKVDIRITPGLQVRGDPTLLKVMLGNLIGNAWKFTARTPLAVIEFGRMERRGVPVFFVRDNGAGFDMAYADKLFQPFQRLHRGADFPGTGVGLASVQRILRRHGGTIEAEGKEGGGATFYFTLGNQEY